MAPTLLLDQNDKRRRTYKMCGCRFGRWKVTSSGPPDEQGRDRWYCLCECGSKKLVRGRELRGGKSLSCGCYRTDRIIESHRIHETKDARLYNIWNKMVRRCVSPVDSGYKDYGARGIAVCQRWLRGAGGKSGLDCFAEDMGLPPTPQHTIDRIDNNGGYTKSNCRWATRTQQVNNRRNSVYLEYQGDTKPLIEWSRSLGIPYGTLYDRLRRGLDVEDILSPSRKED